MAFHSGSVLLLAGPTNADRLDESAVVLVDATTGRVTRRLVLDRGAPKGLLLARDRVVLWDAGRVDLLESTTGEQVAHLDQPVRGRNAGAAAVAGAVVIACRGDRGGQRSGLLVVDDDPT